MKHIRFIAGSGRSGTTWILDAFAEANALRPVFEPLNPFASAIGHAYAERSISAGESHPELKQYLEQVIAGSTARFWTQYRRHRGRLLPKPGDMRSSTGIKNLFVRWGKFLSEAPGLGMATIRSEPLVKCIWANLMLDWIHQEFDARIVLIVRHPGAVIESELRSEWKADDALDRFRSDSQFDSKTQGRYRAFLGRSLTNVEGLAVRWLVENQMIIEDAKLSKITVVHYEHLATLRSESWEIVRTGLELQHVPDLGILTRPSQQSAMQNPASMSARTTGAFWESALTQEQLQDIQQVLDDAGFTVYAMNDSNPKMTRDP